MKAITLTQAWATLTVALPVLETYEQRPLKGEETRTFQLAAKTLPLRLAVHAGQGHAGLRGDICSVLTRRFHEPYASALQAVGYSTRDPWWKQWGTVDEFGPDGSRYKPLPLGAIVGLFTVTRCVKTTLEDEVGLASMRPWYTHRLGNYKAGRFFWVLDDAVELPTPIPCAGAQGIWTVPDDIVAQIAAQGIR